MVLLQLHATGLTHGLTRLMMRQALSLQSRGGSQPRALPWAGMNDAVGVIFCSG
jgi:hypothetical protein